MTLKRQWNYSRSHRREKLDVVTAVPAVQPAGVSVSVIAVWLIIFLLVAAAVVGVAVVAYRRSRILRKLPCATSIDSRWSNSGYGAARCHASAPVGWPVIQRLAELMRCKTWFGAVLRWSAEVGKHASKPGHLRTMRTFDLDQAREE